jgi:crotonobetainyl-CoA:carnitine CoA-transferase CaiB-like acyl-CoA transferase
MLSLQLADFGADVIKVEPPAGDPLRDWYEDGQPLYWKVYGRNKRSIVLDLRQKEGRDALLRLVAQADILIENYRPGTLEKMGLAPAVLHEHNPGLVIVRISGFGQTGPYSQQPGFGTLVEALSGLAARTGFPDRQPVLPPLALADMISGLYGAMAVMIALWARDKGRSGGQVIDLSLLESIFSVLGPEAATFQHTGRVAMRTGSASETSAPRNVYVCADGKYVALSASTEKMAERLFSALGRGDLKQDARFRSNTDRVQNREALDQIVGGWFAARPRQEALDLMRSEHVTVGPVYDRADLIGDVHFRERQIFKELADKQIGSILMHNITPRLSKTPGTWRRPAPLQGEQSEAILSEAGLSEQEIQHLRSIGALG